MTNEFQTALARYEAARGRYRIAILRSFAGSHGGEAIRAAIRECQAARAAIQQSLRGPEPGRGTPPAARASRDGE